MNDPIKVYGVHIGCKYEGGSVDHIFSSHQKAVWYIRNKVKKARKIDSRWTNPRRGWNRISKKCAIEGGYPYYRDKSWERVSANKWERNGMDIMLIIEYEVC